MTNDSVKKKQDINIDHELSIIEQVLMLGDLSKLSNQHRVIYYNEVCKSIGLNPLTRPFEYISLKGKLTLYAKKDCTEQLRNLRKVSITALDQALIDGIYIVTATASLPCGRIDQSKGAVNLEFLKGEDKANAIMKAETKAKRRVTLSICGLGYIDESEIDSISNAKRVKVNHETGEIIDVSNFKNDEKNQIDNQKNDQNYIQIENVEPKKISGFDEFCKKHGLNLNSDKRTRKDEFIVFSCQKSNNMHPIEMINHAIKSENKFIERFEKWDKDNQKTA